MGGPGCGLIGGDPAGFLEVFQHSAASRYGVLMAYSAKAVERRRCRAICRSGSPCRAWAIWGHPEGLCSTHAGRTRGRRERRSRPPAHARYEKCRCEAYAWPHRPGGGFCRWPDPPLDRSPTRAGTHSWPRLRAAGAVGPRIEAILRFGPNAQTRRSSHALDAPPEPTILQELARILRQMDESATQRPGAGAGHDAPCFEACSSALAISSDGRMPSVTAS